MGRGLERRVDNVKNVLEKCELNLDDEEKSTCDEHKGYIILVWFTFTTKKFIAEI
jgi:hypothetical protein